MAYHVLNDELKRLVVQVCNQHMASWQPRPRRGRRPRPGGGGAPATLNLRLAWVTDLAVKNGGTAGKCVLLNDSLQMLDKDGNVTASPLPADKLEFKTPNQYADVKPNSRIWLHSKDSIVAGSVWADAKVWGQYIDVVDYLAALSLWAPKKVLYTPEGVSTPAGINWYGAEC